MGSCFSCCLRGSISNDVNEFQNNMLPHGNLREVRNRPDLWNSPLPDVVLTRQEGYVPYNYVTKCITSEPWYFGKIKRLEAEKLLLLPINDHGAFLIRDSESTKHDYSLSVRYGDKVKHYRIKHLDRSGFFIVRWRAFRTLQDLVNYYRNYYSNLCINLCKPCVQTHAKNLTASASKILDSGAKISYCSPLEKARANLHLNAVTKHLPCREVEYKSINSFLVLKMYDELRGYCCLFEQFFLRALGNVTTCTGIEHSTIESVYTELISICLFRVCTRRRVTWSVTSAIMMAYRLRDSGLICLEQKQWDIFRKVTLNVSPEDISYALDN